MTRRAVKWLSAVAVLATVGCSAADTVDASIEVVAGDNHVRAEGAECNGARPFEHVRNQAPFTIADRTGQVVAEGALVTGQARNADPSVDWGDLERIPTVCVFTLDVTLPERSTYELRLSEGDPLPFERDWITDDAPVLLIVE